MEKEDTGFRIRDLLPLSLKKLVFFVGFYLVSLVFYAITVGQMLDRRIELSRINALLCIFSAVMLCVFTAVLVLRLVRSSTLRTSLLSQAAVKGFSAKRFYITGLLREVLPVFIAGVVSLMPYAVFYMNYGFGYDDALPIENAFTGNMLFILPLGGIAGCIVEITLICCVLAASLYLTQRQILAARIRRVEDEKPNFGFDEDDLP